MPSTAGRGYLYVLVFTTGFTTLGVELSAARLLDPWFGNSLIVWASLIGLILFCLAVGYWAGGLLADRSPHLHTLLRVAALGAVGVGLVPLLSRPVFRLASRGMAGFDAGLIAGSMAVILLLFAVPVILLGCVSPFAVRLALHEIRDSGAQAGRIYAISTAGSILGAFLPVLWLIPTYGTRRTFAILSATLLIVVLAGLLRLRRPVDASLAAAGLALVLFIGWRPAGPLKAEQGLIFETESAYNYIQVLDLGVERQLRLNEGEGIHSVYRPQGGLADGIWDYFLLAPAFSASPYAPDRVRRVAIVGLAAGTLARLLTESYGPIRIEGAELDPEIVAAGKRWFAMDLPNLRALAMDGRRFLAGRDQQFDLIAVDAYRPPYIPFHLTTVEFFDLARSRLSPTGVVAVNVGRTRDDYSLVDAIAATMRQVFPSVYVIDEPDNPLGLPGGGSDLGNSLVVATNQPTDLSDLQANLALFSDPLLAEVARRAAPHARIATPPAAAPVFTDDRAPVEQVVHRLVLRYLLGN
jgi:spermidine synthase